ncbi:hypothetical protein AVEN_133382-1, partial [Araneus ventricosus]
VLLCAAAREGDCTSAAFVDDVSSLDSSSPSHSPGAIYALIQPSLML